MTREMNQEHRRGVERVLRSTPTHDADAERSVLAGMMVDPGVALDAIAQLEATDFYVDSHQQIFKAAANAVHEGSPVSTASIANAAGLDSIFLAGIMNEFGYAQASRANIGVVREASRRRQMADTGINLIQNAYTREQDVDDLLAQAVRSLEGVASIECNHDVDVSSAIGPQLETYERPAAETGIPTPWESVNDMISHVGLGEVMVIGARPSNCKSLAATQIVNQAAAAGWPGGIISLEMPRGQIIDRMICDLSGIESWKFRSHKFYPGDMERIHNAAALLNQRSIRIWDDPSVTLNGIRALAANWVRKHGLKLLVVDYLQLVNSKSQSREREVAEVSRLMKQLAVKHGLAVVVLSQVNRNVESRTKKRLTLADLRESGAVEQDADIVLLIQPFQLDQGQDEYPLTITVAKGRSSATGDARGLVFQRKHLRIVGTGEK